MKNLFIAVALVATSAFAKPPTAGLTKPAAEAKPVSGEAKPAEAKPVSGEAKPAEVKPATGTETAPTKPEATKTPATK